MMSESMTRELAAAARSMPRSGIREIMDLAWSIPEAIHLEVGEPNFETPEHVVEAAARAMKGGATRYTPNAGLPELREALARKVVTRNRVDTAAERIVVTSGAVEALYGSLLALLNPGDGVLLPDPGWPNFRMMAALVQADVQPYTLEAENDYQPSVDDIERSITDRTRVLLVNSPSNPLGTVLDESRAKQLLALAQAYNLWVVSDECYDELVYDDVPTASLGAFDTDERVISVYSFSKTYAMTGWRVGYAALPEAMSATMAKLQEPIISCVNAPGQHAALAAVEGPQQVVVDMRNSYQSRRDLVMGKLDAASIPAQRPAGAFYVWIDISATGLSSIEFARELVTRDKVALVPGTAFGLAGEGAVRVSLATDEALLTTALDRIAARYSALVRAR